MKIGIQLKHEEPSSSSELKSKEEGKISSRTPYNRKSSYFGSCEILQGLRIFAGLRNFAAPAKIPATFDFLSYFFPISPCIIVFDLYILVICIDFGWYLRPFKDFVHKYSIIEVGFWEACSRSSRYSFIFSHFPFFFLTSQTLFEDDFSEDEWLNLSFLEVKGTRQGKLWQCRGFHVFKADIHCH